MIEAGPRWGQASGEGLLFMTKPHLIQELGGTLPEDLPTPTESIQQLQRKEQKQLEQRRQPSLFEGEPEDRD